MEPANGTEWGCNAVSSLFRWCDTCESHDLEVIYQKPRIGKYGGFLKCRYPKQWMVYVEKIPSGNGWWLGVPIYDETEIPMGFMSCPVWSVARIITLQCGGFHKWGYPVTPKGWFINVSNGKQYSNGWFGGIPILGNPHFRCPPSYVCWLKKNHW